MRIGLIDVDGHHFPNLPLMKLSAWHKKHGDTVTWYNPLFSEKQDIVYMSKVFTFTPDFPYPVFADTVIKGGTGYFYPTGGEALMSECESMLRTDVWMRQGCNAFAAKRPISNPMSFWTEQDVLRYIVENDIKIARVYGTIEQTAASLMPEVSPVYRCTGVARTGCMFCMFGVHLEAHPNRFERMRQTHPKIYDYCMNTLGIKQVLDYIGVSVQEGGTI